jgi:small conductance mechanosensitive channel
MWLAVAFREVMDQEFYRQQAESPVGGGMTINFETLKASLVLYGLDAVYAVLLLIVGWYVSGAAQKFVFRVLTVPDALVTVFVASLARYATLAVVGIADRLGALSNLAAVVMLLVFRPFGIG